MKTAFMLEKMNQHENQRAVFGRKANHFEEKGKWFRVIAQALIAIGNNSLYHNLECPEKERNRWRTEQQTSNRLIKENNSS